MSDSRYARQELIPNWSQRKLANAKIAIAGCGALGNEVAKNCALLGIGNIWLVDYDTIEIHNLTRSVLFRESDIGRKKTEAVAQRMRELNQDIHIHQIDGKLEQSLGRGLLREMDVVIGCLDSVNARRELNKRCYFAGVPWIDGGINHYTGNVALFDPRKHEMACYRCKMNSSAWERYNEKYSCGLLKDNYREKTLATTIMTASTVAAYQVEIAVQLILGKSNFQSGTQLSIPLSQPKGFRTINFSLDLECPDHASIPSENSCPPHLFSLKDTPREIAEKLGLSKDWRVELPFEFVSKFTCYSCGHVELAKIPLKEVKRSQLQCPHCHETNREITKFFQIDANSVEADYGFHSLAICTREILQFFDGDRYWEIELI